MSNEDRAEDETGSTSPDSAEQTPECQNKFWIFGNYLESHVGLNIEGYEHIFPVVVTNLAMLPSLTPEDLADLVDMDRLLSHEDRNPAISHLTAHGPSFHSPPFGMPDEESLSSTSFVEDERPASANLSHFWTREVGEDQSEDRYEEDEAPSPYGRLNVFVVFTEEEPEDDADAS